MRELDEKRKLLSAIVVGQAACSRYSNDPKIGEIAHVSQGNLRLQSGCEYRGGQRAIGTMMPKTVLVQIVPITLLVTAGITGCSSTSAKTGDTQVAETSDSKMETSKPLSRPPLSRPKARMINTFALGESPEEYRDNEWKIHATDDDQKRLYDWITALNAGVRGAVENGEGEKVDDPMGLFGINAPSGDSDIPAGLYSCAITKLGGAKDASLPFIAYPAFRCRVTVEDGRTQFVKLTGSQRTTGWIYKASKRHSVYLGTSFYGYENKAISYGETKERDDAAVLHRIGKDRWRMIFPWPYYESVVDVMELTPIKP